MKSILAMSEVMQVQLKNLTTFDGDRVKYFDLHEEFGFASIVERDETVTLDLDGAVIRSWPKGDRPEIWWIKWFDVDHIILDLHGPQVAIVSADRLQRRELVARFMQNEGSAYIRSICEPEGSHLSNLQQNSNPIILHEAGH